MKTIKLILVIGLMSLIQNTFSTTIVVTNSGAVGVSTDNTIVENLYIRVDNSHGINIQNAKNVTIRNCKIEYTNRYRGINFKNAEGLLIENCEIIYTNAPEIGKLPDPNRGCIHGEVSANVTIRNVTLRDGSSGIYLQSCNNSILKNIEGYNMRGPFPRGQLVQWNACNTGLLENFTSINDREVAWTEDNINAYSSPNITIKHGYIKGNNSPSGVGIMFEQEASINGLVDNIDLIEMGNGATGVATNASNVEFYDIRVQNMICGIDLGQGRGLASSNGLMFSGFRSKGNITLYGVYDKLCSGGKFYPTSAFTTNIAFSSSSIVAMEPFKNNFTWEIQTALPSLVANNVRVYVVKDTKTLIVENNDGDLNNSNYSLLNSLGASFGHGVLSHSSTSIDVSTLNPGVYLIKVNVGGLNKVQKFVIQ